MTKEIERIVRASTIVNHWEVELNDIKDQYTVSLTVNALRESSDTGELLKLQNKVRQTVNRAYSIKFVITFTI